MTKIAKDLIPTATCWLCEGEGYLYDEIGTEHDTGAVIEQKTECPECHGVGTLEVETMEECV